MPDGSTSSIRHHIKSKYPTDWVRLLTEEKSEAEQAVAQQLVAEQTLADLEGNPDEIEEDLSQVIQVSYYGEFLSYYHYFRVIFVTFANYGNSGIILVTFVLTFGCTFGCNFCNFRTLK